MIIRGNLRRECGSLGAKGILTSMPLNTSYIGDHDIAHIKVSSL